MPNGQNRYKNEMRKALLCSRRTRKKLMEQFDVYRNKTLEDLSSPNYDQMVSLFGPPEEFAWELMQDVPPDELVKYRREKLICKITAFLLGISLIISSIYILFVKTFRVVETNSYYSVVDEYPTPIQKEETQ